MSGIDGLGPTFQGLGEAVRGEPLRPRKLLGDDLVQELDGARSEPSGFGSMLRNALDDVVERKDDVKEKVEALAAGEPVELHDLMVAMGKSEVTFNLMLEVRNKLVDAWQQISRSVV